MSEKAEDMLLDLLDILHALPADEVLVRKHGGYNVGCNNWTGRMIYDAAHEILQVIRGETTP